MRYSPITVGSVVVELEASDRIVSERLDKGIPFEPDTLKLFPQLIKPGSMFLDIGCYSGLFSIAAVKMGAIAYGFEPMEENRRQIATNQKRNGVDFTVYPVAVSSKGGKGELAYNPKVKLTAGASLDRKSGPKRSVDLVTIDGYGFRNVSCIKIDIEGHEPQALRGMRETLKRERPSLIIEANDGAHQEMVIEELGHGYELEDIIDEWNMYFRPI